MEPFLADLLEALGQAGPGHWLRFSRWGYAAANTAHVLSLAVLAGSILPLDLRLLGFWPRVPLEPLARILVPIAAGGLACAIATGLLLFTTRAADYAGMDLFRLKIALVAAGSVHALALQARSGRLRLRPAARRLAGAVSLSCWLAALVCGRLLAFATD